MDRHEIRSYITYKADHFRLGDIYLRVAVDSVDQLRTFSLDGKSSLPATTPVYQQARLRGRSRHSRAHVILRSQPRGQRVPTIVAQCQTPTRPENHRPLLHLADDTAPPALVIRGWTLMHHRPSILYHIGQSCRGVRPRRRENRRVPPSGKWCRRICQVREQDWLYILVLVRDVPV